MNFFLPPSIQLVCYYYKLFFCFKTCFDTEGNFFNELFLTSTDSTCMIVLQIRVDFNPNSRGGGRPGGRQYLKINNFLPPSWDRFNSSETSGRGLAESAAIAAAFECSEPDRRIGFWPEFEFGFRKSRLTFKLKLACFWRERKKSRN